MNSILVTLLASLVGVFTLQEKPKRMDRHLGFGRGLLKVADLDKDGISELVIVDSGSGRDSALYVYSPGADRCLRKIDNGLAISSWHCPATVIAQTPDSAADIAHIGYDYAPDNFSYFLSLTSSVTGTEVARLPFKTRQELFYPIAVWALGYLDEEAGTEVLVALQQRHRDPEEREKDTVQVPWARTLVVSLPSGEVIREHIGGPQAIADLDGDGVREYRLGTEETLAVHSGRSGKMLFENKRPELRDDEYETRTYFAAPDANGDGVRDILECVYWVSYDGRVSPRETRNYHGGRAYLLSGKTGQRLWQTNELYCTGHMWMSAAVIADRDGDGIDDFAVTYSSEVTGFGDCPGWRIYSGKTGKTLKKFPWENWSKDLWLINGYEILEIDDQDADGVPEVALSRVDIPGNGFHITEVDIYSLEKGLLKRIHWRDLNDQLEREEAPEEK